MHIVCDFQGFRGENNNFVIKELTFMSINKKVYDHFVFERPYDYQQLSKKNKITNKWLTNVYHGLSWDSGFVSYEKLPDILLEITKISSKIYVKGLEKKIFLEKNMLSLNNCVIENVEDLGCASLNKLRTNYDPSFYCLTHSQSKYKICSRENVKNIVSWYNEYITDSEDVDIKVSCWARCKSQK